MTLEELATWIALVAEIQGKRFESRPKSLGSLTLFFPTRSSEAGPWSDRSIMSSTLTLSP